jgi:hypothetical protein
MCARLSVLAHWLLPRAARECTPGTCVREDCVARDDSCVLSAELESCEASEREHSRGRTQDIAPRFYERLKFRPIAERGVYLFMEWTVATRDRREGKRKGIVRHRAVARALHPRHRDDAAARAPVGSGRRRPAAAPSCRGLQSRAAALRAARVSADRRPGGLSVHGVEGVGVGETQREKAEGKREKQALYLCTCPPPSARCNRNLPNQGQQEFKRSRETRNFS